ncbi:LacI family transcriptional regulator [Pacificibacter maritimus]|uniref:LacI family transcriptional regulator n=1 Tax=Pacificibacter maritimus TaxID=762213 RepID=A0A3N4VE90_9RHOB|nr:LacI family DNA-binding transcriptional regulator [Pacificibacter maritimus]RPE72170.1 LacI family transcriptional regulator [Pacificibacter maritimus]
MKHKLTTPAIKQIAFTADVSTATVDRVLNKRPGVRDKTRQKVEAAIEMLNEGARKTGPIDITDLRVGFVLNSTEMLNKAYQDLVPRFAARFGLKHTPKVMQFNSESVLEAASEMRDVAQGLDGIILVARTSAAMVGQINETVGAGTEVVCVTTDFPGSRRLGYVGMDQVAAGRLAARLVALRSNSADQLVALHIGRNWRCEGEREMGFRSTLRDLNFKGRIVELPTMSGRNEEAQALLNGLLKQGHHVDAVYSPSSGVVGLTNAIKDQDPENRTFIIGHELFNPLKDLLQRDLVGAQIGTNSYDVLSEGLKVIALKRAGRSVPSSVFLPAHIIMKENVSELDWY